MSRHLWTDVDGDEGYVEIIGRSIWLWLANEEDDAEAFHRLTPKTARQVARYLIEAASSIDGKGGDE